MTAAASTASATPDASPPKKGKLKLIIVVVAVLALAGGGGGWYYLQQKHKAEAEADQEHEVEHAAPKAPPTFMPLDPMVVNLADPSGERMVQLGITIQMADSHSADQVKAYMPSIRSSILMLVSQRTSEELLRREGKEQLAAAILREVSQALGIEVDDEDEAPPKAEAEADAHKPHAKAKGKGKGKAKAKPVNPVQGVLFSSFIIQ